VATSRPEQLDAEIVSRITSRQRGAWTFAAIAARLERRRRRHRSRRDTLVAGDGAEDRGHAEHQMAPPSVVKRG
jgi:hypothetical protein